MSELHDGALRCLTIELSKTHIPAHVVMHFPTLKSTSAAHQRTWVNEHTDELSRLNLTSLTLFHTPTLAPEMRLFQQLTTLTLNRSTYWLSPVLGQLSNLTELNCSATQLPTIPNSITKLQNLTRLDLKTNWCLKSLPALDELPQLKELDLRQTPVSLLQSPCLERLRARGWTDSNQGLLKAPESEEATPQ